MKVLLPVDGSDRSLATIRQAARMLDKATAQIYLFLVVVPVVAELPTALLLESDEEAAMSILREAEREARNAGLWVAGKEYRIFHDPASAICDYATERQMDQIIIGSHGYQGFAKFLMGSVSERVFKQAEQPVIVIRNDKAHSIEVSHFDKAALKQVDS
jgi:nucleotide-binding universal stress UspA family protein